jgi:hypothetical protein
MLNPFLPITVEHLSYLTQVIEKPHVGRFWPLAKLYMKLHTNPENPYTTTLIINPSTIFSVASHSLDAGKWPAKRKSHTRGFLKIIWGAWGFSVGVFTVKIGDLRFLKRVNVRNFRISKYTVIRFLRVSSKFDTCTVVSVYGTLVEDKICRFKGESAHFSFSKCHIYTHDGASANFSTNSHETDNSVQQYHKRNAAAKYFEIHQRAYVEKVLIKFFYAPERPFMHLTVCCWFLINSGWGVGGRVESQWGIGWGAELEGENKRGGGGE